MALAPPVARVPDHLDLGVDQIDAAHDVRGGALHDQFLLLFEQGQQFAVFLQFAAEGLDQ